MNLMVSVILLLHVILLLLLSLLLSRSIKLWNAVHIMSSIGCITLPTPLGKLYLEVKKGRYET